MSGPRRRKFGAPIVSRVTWHGGRGRQRSRWALIIALARGVPELDASVEPEVVAEPGGEERANRSGRQPEILADGLAREIAEVHDIVPEEAALVKVHDLHRRVGDGLVAGAIGLGDVAELLEPDDREGPRDEILERGEEHAPLVGDLVEGARQRVEERSKATGGR